MKVEVHINGNLVFESPVASVDEGVTLCDRLIEEYKIKELQQVGVRASASIGEVPSLSKALAGIEPLHFNEVLEKEVPKDIYS